MTPSSQQGAAQCRRGPGARLWLRDTGGHMPLTCSPPMVPWSSAIQADCGKLEQIRGLLQRYGRSGWLSTRPGLRRASAVQAARWQAGEKPWAVLEWVRLEDALCGSDPIQAGDSKFAKMEGHPPSPPRNAGWELSV